jgi:fluoride exporter
VTTATRTALASPDEVAVVALGGVLGALARYAVSVAVPHSDLAAWPWGTFVVNLLGCLALGIVLDVVDARHGVWTATRPRQARLARPFLASGVLGGFTTFSTFSVEAVGLAREGNVGMAVLYAVASAVLGVLAVVVGRRVGAAVAGPAAADLREDEDL